MNWEEGVTIFDSQDYVNSLPLMENLYLAGIFNCVYKPLNENKNAFSHRLFKSKFLIIIRTPIWWGEENLEINDFLKTAYVHAL